MDKHLDIWGQKHQDEISQNKFSQPSEFARWVIKYFPDNAKILELGAGLGADSRFFTSNGFSVLATDFSETANKANQNQIIKEFSDSIQVQKLDLTQRFPFKDSSFDVVYSHLSIHYFDSQTTDQIFSEIYRVLRINGVVALLVNSTTLDDYGKGRKLEKDYFKQRSGMIKRFFSINSLVSKVQTFKTIILDDKGNDKERNKASLIRFVGKKLA